MNITSELEKLISLRDRGDLSQAEFEKAKAILLSGENAEAGSAQKATSDTLSERKKKSKTQLIVAICSTLAAVFSGGSMIIDPSPLAAVILVLWVVAATLGWLAYSRAKTEAG